MPPITRFKYTNKKEEKEEMVAWLQAKGIDADMQMLKAENKTVNVRYEIDELALRYGHRVLRIPPCHCVVEKTKNQILEHFDRDIRIDSVIDNNIIIHHVGEDDDEDTTS
ncbi:hypothetical protein SFRURICE_014085 [Spodoptera frugiperda]|nr:hypothetical protein SFRURICE_014085 [Spodoptera frugiperda]